MTYCKKNIKINMIDIVSLDRYRPTYLLDYVSTINY